ncbi:MAG: glycosyltransferase, partial [Cyclobacteriaceae bacterium]
MIKKKVPFITFCTKINLNESKFYFPFISSLIPGNNLLWRTYIKFLWKFVYIKSIIKLFFGFMDFFNISHISLMVRYAYRNDIPIFSIWNFKRCSHFGWKDYPELILSPMAFDFVREYSFNQIYLGPVVELNRLDLNNKIFLNSGLYKLIKSHTSHINIIFCSMGSYDFKYTKRRINFYLQILKIFQNRDDLVLIVSTGKNIDPLAFKFKAKNIFVYQNIPQIQVLKKVDLMINHGGMQSVTECIMLEVPMLIFPLNPNLDQNGNAARAVYHKVGLRGNLKKDSPKIIEQKIDHLLTKRTYFVNNIKKLREKMIGSGDFEKGL